ncbi:MAG TPA: DUF2505 family protein [Acidimicrobiia bacterium]
MTPRAIADLLVDPAFETTVDLPDLSRPTVLEHRAEGDAAVLQLRYEFVGHLDPIAQKLLGGRTLSWIQTLQLDLAAGRGDLSFAAEADPDRLHGAATVELRADGADTVRSFDGELVVKAPVIGGMAERRILPGLLRRLDVEADAVRARLGVPST